MDNLENQNYNQEYQKFQQQFGPQPIPNSTAVLVLGILSIVFCWCWGIIGTILGIITIVLGNKGKRMYSENPEVYTRGSLSNLNAGRVCGIVGLCLSSIYLTLIIIYFVIIGAAAFTFMPWEQLLRH